MLVTILGTRGTIPDAFEGTTSILIDNRFLFDASSELISSFEKIRHIWKEKIKKTISAKILSQYGHPTFSKLQYIFISHLHYDHWIGIPHLLHRSQLLEFEYRVQKPFQIYLPKESVKRFQSILEILLGPIVYNLVKIHPVSPGQSIRILDDYIIKTGQTKHEVYLPKIQTETGNVLKFNWGEFIEGGSISYKIEHITRKLKNDSLNQLGIIPGKILGEIRKKGSVFLNGRLIQSSEIFETQKTSLLYSGDTALDSKILLLNSDVDLIIHESSYIDSKSNYHLENHSSLEDLIKMMNRLFKDQKTIIPIHFSRRYTHEDIKKEVERLNNKTLHTIIKPQTGMSISIEKKKCIVL